MRTAAIGIGSNSLRMLVADIANGALLRLRRYREGLRVFAALDSEGNILPEMIQKACESVEAFREEAIQQGVERVHLFATSAVRDAANQRAFCDELKRATGLDVDICSGDLEARLSFMGATGGEPSGMIDIGGGSTEIVIGSGMELSEVVSLQMGAVRLCRMHPIRSVEDARAVLAIADSILAPIRERYLAHHTSAWVGVGGTFTACAALAQGTPWDMRGNIHGYLLHRDAVRAMMERLAPMSLEERLKLPGLQPQRADIVVHGIAILLCCMNGLDIPVISVSEYGNLEGYLKAQYLCAQAV